MPAVPGRDRGLGPIEASVATGSGTPLSQIFVVLNWVEEPKAKAPGR